MSKLKYAVGDKALIEVVVKDTNNDLGHTPYYIQSVHGTRWINENSLIPIASILVTNTFNVEVGDVIEDYNGDVYKVSTVSLDGNHFYFEKGIDVYIHITEIKAIYKQTWKKEKTLEDMSREELIARIKQLEQGE